MCKVKVSTPITGLKRKILPKISFPVPKTQKLFETTVISTIEEKKNEIIEDEITIVNKNLTKTKNDEKLLTPEQKQQMIDVALIKATQQGNLEKVKDLIENKNANIDATSVGISVLHYAVFYNHAEIVTYLMESGVNFNAVNHSGSTALASAVEKGNTDIAWILLDQADPSLPDKHSLTPLHKAVKLNNFSMVETLLSINTDGEWTKVNAETSEGITPLYLAASKGNVEIVKLLHEWNANLNLSSKSLNSPLQRAVFGNHEAVVTYLVDNGANINTKDVSGRTALDIAIYNGLENMIKLLLSKGANFDASSSAAEAIIKRAKFKKFNSCLELLGVIV